MISQDILTTQLRLLVADQTPPPHALAHVTARGLRLRQRRRALVVGASGVAAALAITAGAIGAVTVFDASRTSQPPPASDAAPPSDFDRVADLTGPAVGFALGLEPIDYPVVGCAAAAQIGNGAAFCVDSVTLNEKERMILLYQITGYPRSAKLEELVDLEMQMEEVQNTDAVQTHEYLELSDRARALRQELAETKRSAAATDGVLDSKILDSYTPLPFWPPSPRPDPSPRRP